jgi:hypothetical protein
MAAKGGSATGSITVMRLVRVGSCAGRFDWNESEDFRSAAPVDPAIERLVQAFAGLSPKGPSAEAPARGLRRRSAIGIACPLAHWTFCLRGFSLGYSQGRVIASPLIRKMLPSGRGESEF